MPTSAMTELFPELITEILSHLPPKAVLRFRCLFKWFCSEIDNPEFSKSHLRHSLKCGAPQALIFRSNLQFHLGEDLLNIPSEESFLTIAPGCPDLDIQLCCSCNGLVVLGNFRGAAAVIWNPNTRKHRILPCPMVIDPMNGDNLITRFWLGYDSLSDDYKLVRIVQSFPRRDEDGINSEVRVYSFKSNAWRHIENLPQLYWHLETELYSTVVAHGAVHFVVTNVTRRSIVALDIHAEQFRELARLPDFGHPNYGLQDVWVLGGRLCTIINFSRGEMEVWAMKDYGGEEESWTKWIRFNVPHDLASLLDYSTSWKRVLLPQFPGDFEWLDFERKVKQRYTGYWQYETLVVGSIVSVGGVDGENETFPQTGIGMLQDSIWEADWEWTDSDSSDSDSEDEDSDSEDEDEGNGQDEDDGVTEDEDEDDD